MADYHIGTAGWSYKDWVPVFYPKPQSVYFDWLRFYAQYFNCVEVNASYYTYISPKTVKGWIQKVSDLAGLERVEPGRLRDSRATANGLHRSAEPREGGS